MLYYSYWDLDEAFRKFPKLVFGKDKAMFSNSGKSYYLEDVVVEVHNRECTIDMSLLNYTRAKWTTLKNKYMDFDKWTLFKEEVKKGKKHSYTYYFNVHEGKQSCLIALVLHRASTRDSFTAHVYYRATEVYKKWPIDLILFNKLWDQIPEIASLVMHIPFASYDMLFLAELIDRGYYTLQGLPNSKAKEIVEGLYEKYYGEGAELSPYHSVARKQKLRAKGKPLPPLPIKSLKL